LDRSNFRDHSGFAVPAARIAERMQGEHWMRNVAVLCAAVCVAHAYAFEIKGITPGDDVSSLNLKACRSVPNADSGVPGYICETTFAGAPAKMTVLVADKKVIGTIVRVEHEVMQPTLQALEEKYGRPVQPNQFMQKYIWSSGTDYMDIEESAIGGGYSVSNFSTEMFEAFTKKKAQKAKSDL
jgi:hypothetical protein